MSLPLIHGPDLTAPLAAWAGERIEHVGGDGFGPCYAVGVLRRDALAAVCVYHDYQPQTGTVQLSIAAEPSAGLGGWASRRVIGALLGFGLHDLGRPLFKAWAAVPLSSDRTLRFLEQVGMKREATLRHHFGYRSHAVICSIVLPEWRKRYGKEA